MDEEEHARSIEGRGLCPGRSPLATEIPSAPYSAHHVHTSCAVREDPGRFPTPLRGLDPASLEGRARGSILQVSDDRVMVKSGVFRLVGGGEYVEHCILLQADAAGILDPGTAPVPHASVRGVRMVSFPALARLFPGIRPYGDLIDTHGFAHLFRRDVAMILEDAPRHEAACGPEAACDPETAYDPEPRPRSEVFPVDANGRVSCGAVPARASCTVVPMVAVRFVAMTLHEWRRVDLEASGKALRWLADRFVEAHPFHWPGEFMYARNDCQRWSPEVWPVTPAHRAAEASPLFMPLDGNPDRVGVLAVPAAQAEAFKDFLRREVAAKGRALAAESSLGLADVEDGGWRSLGPGLPSDAARVHKGRLWLKASVLLEALGSAADVEVVEDAGLSASSVLPAGAVRRTAGEAKRGRPFRGTWWIDAVHARSFAAAVGGNVATKGFEGLMREVEGRLFEGLRRDLAAELVASLPATTCDGDSVFGVVSSGRMLPVVFDASGVPWLSRSQIAVIAGVGASAVFKATARSASHAGPDVQPRRLLLVSLDGRRRTQTHYPPKAVHAVAIELKSLTLARFMVRLMVAATGLDDRSESGRQFHARLIDLGDVGYFGPTGSWGDPVGPK